MARDATADQVLAATRLLATAAGTRPSWRRSAPAPVSSTAPPPPDGHAAHLADQLRSTFPGLGLSTNLTAAPT